MTLSPELIATLRALEKGATPGEWFVTPEVGGTRPGDWFVTPEDGGTRADGSTWCVPEHLSYGNPDDGKESWSLDDGTGEGDLQLIAALRNAAVHLLDAVEENAMLRADQSLQSTWFKEINRLREVLRIVVYTNRSRGYPTPKEWDEIVGIAKAALETP